MTGEFDLCTIRVSRPAQFSPRTRTPSASRPASMSTFSASVGIQRLEGVGQVVELADSLLVHVDSAGRRKPRVWQALPGPVNPNGQAGTDPSEALQVVASGPGSTDARKPARGTVFRLSRRPAHPPSTLGWSGPAGWLFAERSGEPAPRLTSSPGDCRMRSVHELARSPLDDRSGVRNQLRTLGRGACLVSSVTADERSGSVGGTLHSRGPRTNWRA